jgi:hypothetical protein
MIETLGISGQVSSVFAVLMFPEHIALSGAWCAMNVYPLLWDQIECVSA